jgi:hypothetical protein
MIINTLICSSATAGITIVQATFDNYVGSRSIPGEDWWSVLDPALVQHIPSASQILKDELAERYPTWTFTYSGALNGTLTIDKYKATAVQEQMGQRGGAYLEATYTRAAGDPPIGELFWIQLIKSQVFDPVTPAYEQFIDPLGGDDDGRPFYWDPVENEQYSNQALGTLRFIDGPWRYAPEPMMTIDWEAELMLAAWSGGGSHSVTVYDGARWGFRLSSLEPNRFPPRSVPEPNGYLTLLMGVAGFACARLQGSHPCSTRALFRSP